jgi:hypothetical protein
MIPLRMLKIECFLSESCGSEEALKGNLKLAIELEGADAEVVFHRIDAPVARALGLKGSPSILINGADISPVEMQGFG